MNQKTMVTIAKKFGAIGSEPEISKLEFLKFTGLGNNLQGQEQAIHNVLFGMELTSVLENACCEIEGILTEVKQWVSYELTSSLNDSSTLNVRISQKLREFNLTAEAFSHNGQKLFNGSLSASANTETHSFLVVGANSYPENRINLNTILNIPPINTETLGLCVLTQSPEKGLEALMILENALKTLNRLKQRSRGLGNHLLNIQIQQATALENHHAANSSPGSYDEAEKFLRTTSNFIEK